ncbi:MAG: HDOD domain-containing protein [Desulfobacteraceae bacterium]|nr:HDOD domain-containing protein [Desulfobacteraceae bacterium]
MDIHTHLPSKSQVETVLDRDITDLPAFPVVALKVVDLIGKDDASAADIARVIESDPAVTAKVLRLVNSAAYGLRSQISSVKEGVTYLGISKIRQLALQVTLFEQIVRPQKTVIFDRTFFWQHCLAVAGLSMALAEEINYPKPEEAYVAGLLHDIGKTILDGYGCISYGDFLKNLLEPDSLKITSERKVIGISHDDIGAYYCASCNIPNTLLFAIKFHHQRFGHLNLSEDDGKLISIVSLSNFLAWTQGLGSADILRYPVLLPEVETHIDFNAINLPVLLDRMDQEIKRTAELYQFEFPSIDQFRMNLLRANIELARMNTAYYYRQNEITSPEKSTNVSSRPLPSPERLIQKTMEAVQNDFGYDRLYLLKIDRDKRCLVPVHVFDVIGKNEGLSSLYISINKKSQIVTTCLRKRKPVIIDGKIPKDMAVLEMFDTKEMAFVPFSHNNRLLGVLGLDNCYSGDPINISDLGRLCSAAQDLGVAFDQSLDSHKNRITEHMDALTKLYSQGYLEKQLQILFANKMPASTELFLVIIKIDFYKDFIDRFGFLEGESVLKLVAGILNKLSRLSDCAGRFDTDKFMVILNNMSLEKANYYSERIRSKRGKLGNLLTKRFPEHSITVSIGMAKFTPLMQTKNQMIELAKQALGKAQKAGGNTTVIL